MSTKSQRKVQQQLSKQKALRQKDLGVRLMVLGPLLSYASLLFMNSGQLFMPLELYGVVAFIGFAMVFAGSVLVERAFRSLAEIAGGLPGGK